MFITVMYKDGKVGVIKDQQLDHLIKSGKIKKFMRSEGWVTIGVDQIRGTDEVCKGQERRQNIRKKDKQ